MEEDEKVIGILLLGVVRLSICYVVKFHAISDLVESVFETFDGLLGEIPELIACCRHLAISGRVKLTAKNEHMANRNWSCSVVFSK